MSIAGELVGLILAAAIVSTRILLSSASIGKRNFTHRIEKLTEL